MDIEDLKKFTTWLVRWCMAAIGVAFLIGLTPIGRDDSDRQGWGDGRSGVTPVIDARTGCQYLRTSDGGITPRNGADGHQLGCGNG